MFKHQSRLQSKINEKILLWFVSFWLCWCIKISVNHRLKKLHKKSCHMSVLSKHLCSGKKIEKSWYQAGREVLGLLTMKCKLIQLSFALQFISFQGFSLKECWKQVIFTQYKLFWHFAPLLQLFGSKSMIKLLRHSQLQDASCLAEEMFGVSLEYNISFRFFTDPSIPGVRSMGPSLSKWPFWDLTDVTLADEDSNSIPTDDVNRAFLGNMAMQEAPPGGQNWN